MKRRHFWLGVVVSAAFIALALSRVEDWAQFGDAFVKANYRWIPLVIAANFFLTFLRAVRWRYILNQTSRVTLRTAWVSYLVCYMGNNIFPLRAGELMRVFFAGKLEPGLDYSEALATVVVERLFDFIVMLMFLAVVLLTISFPEKEAGLQRQVHGFAAATLTGSLLLLAFLILLHLRKRQTTALVAFFLRPLPAKWRERIMAELERFTTGLEIMGRPLALLAVTVMGVVIWLAGLLPIWLSGQAFQINIGFMAQLFMAVAIVAAVSIPAAPGFFGTFHSFNQMALIFIMQVQHGREISGGTALAFAVVLHACYWFPMIVAGAFVAWREGYSLTRLRAEAEKSVESDL